MNQHKTKVIFKKHSGEIIAFFPELKDGIYMTCYAHIGQHSNACHGFYRECKPASPEEYESLKRELTAIGYNLQVMKRLPRAR